MAKQVTEPESEEGIVKVVDPLLDVPADVNARPELPPGPSVTHSGPSLGERIRGFFRFLLRLLALLLILGILGLGLYYGLPLLYQRYIMPVEQNTAGVTELQSQQKQTAQELADLQTKLQTLETVQDQHDQSLTKMDKRLSDVEKEITARTKSLDALEKMQSELQAQDETTTAELKRQINLLKSMELLSRARLFMYESNFGLARQDVQIARDVLAAVQPDAPKDLAADLEEVVRRLDLTLFNLPDFPVAASDDLDIAWQILLTGSPPTQTGAGATPVATASLPVTPAPTFTTTLVATSQPSQTP
jgi:hypothetical protein